jgi:hypothetical protein
MRTPLLSRVQGVLLRPKEELPRTLGEPGDFGSLLPYVLSLASIGAVAGFLSAGVIGTYLPPEEVFGMKIGGGYFREPVRELIVAILRVAISVGAWWFFAFMLDALSPTFGGRRDDQGAYKLAAYTATPIWVAGALGLLNSVPYLGVLDSIGQLVAFLYAVLIGIWALPLLMGTPESKAPGHILVSLVVTAIAVAALWYLVVHLLLGMVTATLMR